MDEANFGKKEFVMKIKKIISILCVLLIAVLSCGIVCGCSDDDKDAITVEGGKIKGAQTKTENVVAYKGIPYAAPPTGENRWRAPQPVKSWKGVKDCTKFGPSAMQAKQKASNPFTAEFIIADTENYSEDCLTLNVWTKTDDVANKPVLVYIHGGAWVSGGSSCEIYDGEYMASQDIVFVSVNYRLGIFGWFASAELAEEDPEGSTGNYGFMDIVKSLEWVRDNIAVFGGDKNNVTIMGQSAGGNMVDTLLVSPKAEGLFHHAINMSFKDMGGEYGNFSARKNAGNRLGKLSELRALSAEELLKKKWDNIGCCLDGVYVTENFQDRLSKGASKNIDVMSGMVPGDAMLYLGLAGWGQMPQGVTASECLMGVQTTMVNARKMGFGEEENHGNTYLYLFNHVMPGKLSSDVFHTSDVPYFMNHLSANRAEYWQDADRTVAATASAYLINFCKTGNPNGEGLTQWTQNEGDYTYLHIKETCEMQSLTPIQQLTVKATFSQKLYGGIPQKFF